MRVTNSKKNTIFSTIFNIIGKNVRINIIFIHNFVCILAAVIFYPVIPIILNYPPVSNAFDLKMVGYTYSGQYFSIVAVLAVLGSGILWLILKDIDNTGNKDEISQAVKKKYLNLPYQIYILQISLSMVFITVPLVNSLFHFSDHLYIFLIIKLFIILFTYNSLVAIMTLVFSKRIFSKILLKTYLNEKLGIRIGIKNKFFLYVVPMLVVAILFTSLVGYSRLIKEKGNLLFDLYKNKLVQGFNSYNDFSDANEVQKKLRNLFAGNSEIECFAINPEGELFIEKKDSLSKYFIGYLNELSNLHNGRIYDSTGEIQGVMIKVDNWKVGIKYKVVSKEIISFFLMSFFVLLCINIFILSYFSKSISDDISLVAHNLNDLAEGGKIDLDKKIPVTSNDEIGDLVIAFNKIQDLEKENIRKLKERHEMLIQSERLAALGQMIGGIAHNLKTPIVSISGGTEALKDLINEYQDSVDDLSVTKEDHREIAGEMLDWVKEIRSHCAYMSDIISAVKEQAVQMNYSSGFGFTLEELIKRIDILMKYELKKYNCRMEMDIQVDIQTEIQGELNNLVQVFNNLIINAIHAYDGRGGKIDLRITRNQKGDLEFGIKDYGKGMAQEVRERLFKEMVTTKGTKGTGMGLYMSYLTIKGKFGGTIRFESEEGKGTAFYLTVPVANSRTDAEVS